MVAGKGGSYYDVISEAIDDLAEHGFSSVERVAYWERRIKEAAEASFVAAATMEQMLRDALAATYRRLVEGGRIAKYHPGVARWTVEKVRPALRAELDRRIAASANLIRLNRRKQIEATLQRFSGWATSIPAGGSDQTRKREEKMRVRKPLASLPFEERRVLTDQGHKLISSLNEIVAADGGAIGGFWRSNYRQPGYDYREDHKDRDGKFYTLPDSWAYKAGLVKKGEDHVDAITRPAEEPFCRCFYRYAYSLRDVPEQYLTAKGKAMLEAGRAKAKAG